MRMSKQCLVHPKKFVKTITDQEVRKTIKKINNRTENVDNVAAELGKYTLKELHIFIQEILNIVREHQHLDIGSRKLVVLQKSGKPKGHVKKLRLVNVLLIIRKILSITQ